MFNDSYILVSDTQDIEAVLECIGKKELFGEIGHMFVQIGEGEYTSVYSCRHGIPWTSLTKEDYEQLV